MPNEAPSDGVTVASVEAELEKRLTARDAEIGKARQAANAVHNPKINKCRALLRYLKQQ